MKWAGVPTSTAAPSWAVGRRLQSLPHGPRHKAASRSSQHSSGLPPGGDPRGWGRTEEAAMPLMTCLQKCSGLRENRTSAIFRMKRESLSRVYPQQMESKVHLLKGRGPQNLWTCFKTTSRGTGSVLSTYLVPEAGPQM